MRLGVLVTPLPPRQAAEKAKKKEADFQRAQRDKNVPRKTQISRGSEEVSP